MANKTKRSPFNPNRPKGPVHFHGGDDRFCGALGLRRFTVDPDEVTCEGCKARDTFVLSPAAAEYVRGLERKRGAKS